MTFRNFRFALEFAPVWAIDKFLTSLPRSWCIRGGEFLGAFFSLIMKRRNVMMRTNLSRVFPEKSEREIEALRKNVWINIGRVLGEFLALSDIGPNNFRDFFDVENEELIHKAKAEGRGVILISFHFTNWELTGVGTSLNHGDVQAVARPIKNPFVQSWISKKRGGGGVNFILHRQAVKGCLKALKDHRAVGILVDQNLYTGGVFVDFLGKTAATTTLPALLHVRTGAPVLLTYCLRGKDRLRLVYEELPSAAPLRPDEDPVLKMTESINARLGELVRAYPENWFWVHNRWKRQPLP